MSNRFWDEPPWLRSIRDVTEHFRETEWLRSFNEANSRINQITQLQNIWEQNMRLLDYSLQFERVTESIRIWEATQPMFEMQNRLKDILGNQQLLQSIDRTTRLHKELFTDSGLMKVAQEATAWYDRNAILFRSIETLMHFMVIREQPPLFVSLIATILFDRLKVTTGLAEGCTYNVNWPCR